MRALTVVGGGLAGAFVAAEAIARGYCVVQYDYPAPAAASPAAAGLFNVLTGAHPTLTYRAGSLLAQLMGAFKRSPLSELAPLLHRVPILRLLHTVADLNDAAAFACEPTEEAPFSIRLLPPMEGLGLRSHVGVLRLEGAGWLDAPAFVAGLPEVLARSGRYERVMKAYDWAALRAAVPIVSCEGIGVNANPWYPARALQPLGGELLLLAAGPPLGWPEEAVLVGGGYAIVRPEGAWWVGSTHRRLPAVRGENPLGHLPTAAERAHGRRTILGHYARWFPGSVEPEVAEQRYGARPTTPDRQPYIGKHAIEDVWFVGGLGTKGVLWGPTLAVWLCDAIEGQPAAWPAEVDLYRAALRP